MSELTSRNALVIASEGVPVGFHVGMGNQVAGHLAGELADGMRTHPVGDHEDMAALRHAVACDARTEVWLSWLFARRMPVSVAAASMIVSSQFTA